MRATETTTSSYVCKNSFCGATGKEKYTALKTTEKNFAKKYLRDCLKAISLPKENGFSKNLLDTLKTSLQKNPPEMLFWMSDHFNIRNTELAQQILN
ncbi:hypothetical protein [Pedobacter panaciterrae]|uniref:hypothetical protein n=1 Tax=Pedobacter panaciterrae TaxID=363849 RepID=UPI002594CBD6|nr:hypothetical protein [uncultured Pedobacter sp.]